jgi:hypothetical protein
MSRVLKDLAEQLVHSISSTDLLPEGIVEVFHVDYVDVAAQGLRDGRVL